MNSELLATITALTTVGSSSEIQALASAIVALNAAATPAPAPAEPAA